MELCCTVCGVDLRDASAFEHPHLPVAACVLCLESLRDAEGRWTEPDGGGDGGGGEEMAGGEKAAGNEEVAGVEDLCSWCAGDRGDGDDPLFCCDACPRVWCEPCVAANLGREVVAIVRERPRWECFSCEPKVVKSDCAGLMLQHFTICCPTLEPPLHPP